MQNAVMRATMTRIGFTEAAAQAIVEDQGIDSLDEIKLLTDEEIESLCRVLRKPGGMIPGVGAGAAQVQNPGVQVNQRAEGHLKLLAFYLRHQARVSREVNAPDITLESIRSVRELREFESTYKTPTDNVPAINAKDWPKTMESIEEYLRSYLGTENPTRICCSKARCDSRRSRPSYKLSYDPGRNDSEGSALHDTCKWNAGARSHLPCQ
ncbi:hypothetical protein MHU86_18331 [Fragilaria crotonensis]|nr:hypothetical protein MHU86_18331 [Fragilaria crotonensis]